MGGRLQLQDSSRPFEGGVLQFQPLVLSCLSLLCERIWLMAWVLSLGLKRCNLAPEGVQGYRPGLAAFFFFVSIYPLHILKHPLSLNYPVHLLSAKWNRGGFSPFLRIFLPLFQGGFSNSAKAVFYRFFMRHIFAENWAVFAESANAVKNRCGFFWRKADEQAKYGIKNDIAWGFLIFCLRPLKNTKILVFSKGIFAVGSCDTFSRMAAIFIKKTRRIIMVQCIRRESADNSLGCS